MVRITRIIQKIGAMLVIACILGTSAEAHESRPARVKLSVKQQNLLYLEITLDLERFLTSTQIQTPDSHGIAFETVYRELQSLTPEALSGQLARVVATGARPLALVSEIDQPIELTLDFADTPALPSEGGQRESTLYFSASLLPKESAVRLHAPVRGTALIASVNPEDDAANDGASQPVYLLPGETSPLMLVRGVVIDKWSLISSYVKAGFTHVLPLGFDHVLFVIALVLVVPGWRRLLLQVSLFTLGHSIALALASTGFVHIPASVVEPLIAVSIICMAAENLRRTHHLRLQTILVFAFGLVHGLGFASVLITTGLSTEAFVSALLAFNIGIELAQLAIVMLCCCLGWLVLHSSKWRTNPFGVPASLLLGSAGGWLLIERTML